MDPRLDTSGMTAIGKSPHHTSHSLLTAVRQVPTGLRHNLVPIRFTSYPRSIVGYPVLFILNSSARLSSL